MNKIWSLLFLMVVSACQPKEREVKKMWSNEISARTYCVGRHLIDIPESFVINPISTGIFSDAENLSGNYVFDVVVHNGSLTVPEFSVEMQKRRSELKSADDGTVDVFELEKTLSEDAKIFRVRKIDDAYISEINFLRGGSLITVKLNSFEQQYLPAEEALVNFATRFKALKKSSDVEYNGFCLGSVILGGSFDREIGSISFLDDKGQNFELDINTYAPDANVPLLKRMSGPDSLMNLFKVNHTVLRARERAVAGMRAQEWLGWAKLSEEEDSKTLKFALDTLRAKPGKGAPSISLTFNTAQPLKDGLPTKTVITDDEAIHLWDTVVGSIRQINQTKR